MTWPHIALLLAAGVGAGAINTVVGSGSLLTYGALLSLGYAPVTAAVINTVGLVPGSVSGAIGYRSFLPSDRSLLVRTSLITVAGASLGAVLLLVLPPHTFAVIVPYCIVAAAVLVLVQPMLSRRQSKPQEPAPVTPEPSLVLEGSPATSSAPLGPQQQERTELAGEVPARSGRGQGQPVKTAWLLLVLLPATTYSGYFAAGLGIILVAALGSVLPTESLQRLTAIKMLLGTLVGVAASTVLIGSGRLLWLPALLLGGGTLLGGWLGAVAGRRMSTRLLRALVVAVGLASALRAAL